jgi:hypothetical protein
MAVVGLVSCVKTKREYATEARDLCISPWLKNARKYIESRCQNWYILSAKYDLVHPTSVIDSYEQTLPKKRLEREQWAQAVWKDLVTHVHAGDHIIILAGKPYWEYLRPKLEKHGCFFRYSNGAFVGNR